MGGAYSLSFTVLAPDAPAELRLEASERRFDEATPTVEFDESIGQDIALPSIEISTIDELQAIQTDSDFPLDGYYKQTADVDASSTASSNGGSGFEPIGGETVPFSGRFNGNGFTIIGLTIDRPEEDLVGVFGKADSGALLENVILENVSIQGGSQTGALVGLAETNTAEVNIRDSRVSGEVKGEETVGALVGEVIARVSVTVERSTASADVEGESRVGGLIGDFLSGSPVVSVVKNSEASGSVTATSSSTGIAGGLIGESNDATIRNSKASGNVDSESERAGGLIGYSFGSTVDNSEATGSVTGTARVGGLIGDLSRRSDVTDSKATGSVQGESGIGGLVGYSLGSSVGNSEATGRVKGTGSEIGGLIGRGSGGLIGRQRVRSSVARGNVTGGDRAGGLIGFNQDDSRIVDSYAEGDVSGDKEVGGLVGGNVQDSEIAESYAVGKVSGNEDVGGLVGVNGASISSSYWDTETTGQSDGVGRGSPDGTTGLTTSEMQGNSAEENMDGFDFQSTWQAVMGDYPALQWEE
ncbi:hypothetical protein GGP94_003340 [Salinibacter ruber]|nr:hypothetical protein [Salinibacter ruber]